MLVNDMTAVFKVLLTVREEQARLLAIAEEQARSVDAEAGDDAMGRGARKKQASKKKLYNEQPE